MKTTDPRERLRSFLADPSHPERSRSWLADLLGISQPAVSQWLATGDPTRPDEKYRVPLEQITGIPADAWLTDEERSEKAARERRLRQHLKLTGTDGR